MGDWKARVRRCGTMQRAVEDAENEIERLREIITQSERTFDLIRGNIETGQVVDKDAHGKAVRGRDLCRAALSVSDTLPKDAK